MAIKFNALSGQFDLVDIFDEDLILVDQFFEVMTDQNGNVLLGV